MSVPKTSARSSPKKSQAAYVLPLLGLLLTLPTFFQGLKNVAGHVHVDARALSRYDGRPRLNSHNCTVIPQANACEDVKIHYASHTAFAACGDPEARTLWYPPIGAVDADRRPANTWRESIFTYDILTKKTVELRIEDAPEDWEFISHGIDLWFSDDDAAKIHIFAVNHGRKGDSITVFEHTLGQDTMHFLKDVKHPYIRNANAVAAAGPL